MAGRRFNCLGFALCLGAFVICVYAANKDFWSAKPYTQWTQKEVDKMLKNSPWSKEIAIGSAPIAPSETAGEGAAGGAGDMSGEGAMGGGGGGGRGSRRGGQSPNEPNPTMSSITVSWFARPVREAMAQRNLLGPEPQKDAVDKLLKYENPFYSLWVYGYPGGGGRGARGARGGRGGDAMQQLRQETFLRKKNKEKIPVAGVMMPSGRGQALILQFAKQQDGRPTLTLEDREVELMLKVGGSTYHIKFKLADMVINKQLEL